MPCCCKALSGGEGCGEAELSRGWVAEDQVAFCVGMGQNFRTRISLSMMGDMLDCVGVLP